MPSSLCAYLKLTTRLRRTEIRNKSDVAAARGRSAAEQDSGALRCERLDQTKHYLGKITKSRWACCTKLSPMAWSAACSSGRFE
jgi:hypothetical protein